MVTVALVVQGISAVAGGAVLSFGRGIRKEAKNMTAIPGFIAERSLVTRALPYRALGRTARSLLPSVHPAQEGGQYFGDDDGDDDTGGGNGSTGGDGLGYSQNWNTLTCVDDCSSGDIDAPECNDCENMIDSGRCIPKTLRCQYVATDVSVCTCYTPPLVA